MYSLGTVPSLLDLVNFNNIAIVEVFNDLLIVLFQVCIVLHSLLLFLGSLAEILKTWPMRLGLLKLLFYH